MAFAPVDYGELNRMSSNIGSVLKSLSETQQFELAQESDRRDRQNTASVLASLAKDLQPTISVDEKGKQKVLPKTPDQVFTSASQALAGLSATGGRHALAASKNVLDLMAHRLAMKAPTTFAPKYAPVSAVNKKGEPEIIEKDKIQYQKQQYMNLSTGEVLPSPIWVPKNEPGTGAGGYNANKDISPLFQMDPQGLPVLARDKEGRTTPITKPQQKALLEHAMGQAQARTQAIEKLQNELNLAEMQYNFYNTNAAQGDETSAQEASAAQQEMVRLKNELDLQLRHRNAWNNITTEVQRYNPTQPMRKGRGILQQTKK